MVNFLWAIFFPAIVEMCEVWRTNPLTRRVKRSNTPLYETFNLFYNCLSSFILLTAKYWVNTWILILRISQWSNSKLLCGGLWNANSCWKPNAGQIRCRRDVRCCVTLVNLVVPRNTMDRYPHASPLII